VKMMIDSARKGKKMQEVPRDIHIFNDRGLRIAQIHFEPHKNHIHFGVFFGLSVEVTDLLAGTRWEKVGRNTWKAHDIAEDISALAKMKENKE